MDGGTGSRLVGVKIVLDPLVFVPVCCECVPVVGAVPSSGGGVAVGW